jgi:hypothetical protein
MFREGRDLAARVEAFVREQIVPYERDPRCGAHGPTVELVTELRQRARASGLLTPHILPDGSHITHRETARVLRAAGLSPLGPIALDFYVAFNMFRLAAIFHGIKGRLARGTAASAQARAYAAGAEWMAEMAWAQVQRAGAGH